MRFLSALLAIFTTVTFNLPPATASTDTAATLDAVVPERTYAEIPAQVVKASNDFGFDLFTKLRAEHIAASSGQANNEAISPISVFLALAIVYNGAGPAMLGTMADTLKARGFSIESLNTQARQLNALLTDRSLDFTLNIANSAWVRSGFELRPEYVQKMKDDYEAQVSTLDFSLPESAAFINKWASDKTQGRITSVVGDRISPESVLLLLNATYFKAEWSRPFWARHTRAGSFRSIDPETKRLRTARATMMNRLDRLRYAKMSDWQAVELPYGPEGNASMIIALPPQLPPSQQDTSVLPKIIERVLSSEVAAGVLRMPKFKFFASNSLKNTLSRMGMQQAFSTSADFSLMTKARIALSEVMQKVHVSVDEHGTEAAASTSIDIVPTASPLLRPVFYMNVNHPFYFAIRDNRSGVLLFLGYVQQPTL